MVKVIERCGYTWKGVDTAWKDMDTSFFILTFPFKLTDSLLEAGLIPVMVGPRKDSAPVGN